MNKASLSQTVPHRFCWIWLLAACQFFSFFAGAPSFAVDQFTGAVAVEKIRAAKIIKPERQLDVFSRDRLAIARVDRARGASDIDCKIDTMFIAKTLLSAFPGNFDSVRCVFTDPDFKTPPDAVVVTAAQLQDFSTGKIDKTTLLDFIQLTHLKNFSIGDFRKRIFQYWQAGYNVKEFRTKLQQLKRLQDTGGPQSTWIQLYDDLAKNLHMGDEGTPSPTTQPLAH